MKSVVVLVVAGSLGVLAACSSSPRAPAPKIEFSTVVDSRPIAERLPLGMEKRIERGLAFGFVGASSESGKSSTWVRGLKSVEPPSKLSETSVVEIGSVSKTMTGILIHLAVLEGKLSLSTKLEEILPSLREKPAGAITVAALGLHCSGLPRSIPGLPIVNTKDPYRAGTERVLLEALASATSAMPAECATNRAYSNFGYAVLGLLLEKTYRKPFREILRTKLVRPLRLGETAIDRMVGSRRRRRPKVVHGYTAAGDVTSAWTFPGAYAAAGGVEMSSKEMARFLEALVDPPAIPVGRAISESMVSGIGWDSAPGAKIAWKNGMTGGFATILMVNPAAKNAVMATTNIAIIIDGFGAVAMGLLPKDPLVEAIESGRVTAPEEEVTRMKGQYVFAKLLDDDQDEIDPKGIPAGEIPALPTALEVVEKSGRIVGRARFAFGEVGFFLYPETKGDRWHLVDGIYNEDTIEIEGDEKNARLLAMTHGKSRKEYWYEFRKLEKKLEKYPAMERE